MDLPLLFEKILLGLGFTLSPDEAQQLIVKDPRNSQVLLPYLNGQDLNSNPDQSPSRWVINFFDWPLEKAEEYPDCLSIVREKVYPQRMQQKRESRQRYWWRYGEIAANLYRAIVPLQQVLTAAQTSKYLSISFQPKGIVYDQTTIVIAYDKACYFAVWVCNRYLRVRPPRAENNNLCLNGYNQE
jgi:hypothetical protein